MRRVLAVGLDSVDEVDLQARLDAGQMPHLSALRARGTWCSLSIDPLCHSEHPWPAFATGLDPSQRGRWTPLRFDPTTYSHATVGAPDVEPFWALGDDLAVVSLDVPGSAPTDGQRSVNVVDWSAHEPPYPRHSSPPEVMADLDARFGANPATPLEYAGTWNDVAWLRRFGAALVASTQMRTKVIEHLLSSTPDWRLGLVVFTEAHQVAHHAWHGVAPGSVLHQVPSASVGREVLGDLHRALDEAIGQLAATLDPDDVLVVFSPKGNDAICDLLSSTLVPELFHRLMFGAPRLRQPSVTRWERRGRPPVVLPAGMVNIVAMRAAFSTGWVARARYSMRLAGSMAASMVASGLTDRLRLRHRQRPRPPWVAPDPTSLAPLGSELPYPWYVATWYRPWWPRMAYFVLPSFSDLHVRVNVVGREREGVVAAGDFEGACDEVEQTLRACRNPRTGHELVAHVRRPRGADPFAEVGLAADVVVSWAEDTDVLEHPQVGIVGPYPVWRAGSHAARGFALFAGGDVGQGSIAGPRLVDLSATLLALAALAPRAPIDGTPFPLPPRAYEAQ